MKKLHWSRETGRRLLSLFLAVCVGMIPALLCSTPAASAAAQVSDTAIPSPSAPAETDTAVPEASASPAAPDIAPSCDEAFYATLDYYGQLTESSVVKSYTTNGNTKITDYGAYDGVTNLTDNHQPTLSGDSVTFDLSGNTPQRLYFEGKTQKPFQTFPWTISLSYTLNGVPTSADQLAGKTGVVEIHLDVIPNPAASEYSKNNMVLTATTAFSTDGILSLEAPGAQVQLVGNLRTVLYMILPGEEQHFVISVGSDDFSFDGMVFLAVPATLQQLDQVADLREDKEKTEDSYNALNDSLDVILNTLDGMSGSLNTAASGLEHLNSARSTFSAGKDGLYDQADQALGDLNTMADALAPAAEHLETASQTLTDVNNSLTDLTQTAEGLKPELETTRSILKELKTDTANFKKLLTSVESYTKEESNIASDLGSDLEDMGDNLDDLQSSLSALKNVLNAAAGSSLSSVDDITYDGMTLDEINQTLSTANYIYEAYYAANSAYPLKPEFTQMAIDSGIPSDQANALADFYYDTYLPDKTDIDAQLEQLETANDLIDGVNGNISSVNALLSGIASPTAKVLGNLSDLCVTLGDSGVSGDLESLSDLISDLLKDVDTHKGEGTELLDHLDEFNDLAARVSDTADTALDQLQTLDDTVNAYIPDAQQALSDAQTLSASTADNLRSAQSFLSSLESLAKQSDGDLDEGTKQSLTGVSEALRRSSAGLEETDTIRNAKETITSLIDSEWDDHTGGDNNVLLMDSQAKPVSLTSEKNPSPASIQYLMRTQEIQVEDNSEDDTTDQQDADNGTFWSRVGTMFHDLWSAIVSPFQHSGKNT